MLNLDKNKKYLLACSYGPDSMALFSMLKKDGICFDVAHVNYHFRDESNFEEESLVKYCKENNVSIYVHDVGEIEHKNIEEQAREIRYHFFADVIQRYKYDVLLVAHNLDDHLETYLLQIKRQNLPIYYGIASNSTSFGIDVIRPLLAYSKADLQKYNDDNNIPYAIDKSNLEDTYERNKIRHHIIAKMNDNDKLKLAKEIDTKNEELINTLNSIKKCSIKDTDKILKMSDIEFAYFMTSYLRETIPDFELSLKFSKEIKKALKSKKANIIIGLNPDFDLLIEYGAISIGNKKDCSYKFTYNAPSKDDNEYFFMDFTKCSSDRNVRKESYPITIRPVDPKDVIQISNYKVKARRLLIDWKMPISLRRKWPVIVDINNKVIYIPRYQKNFKPDKCCNFFVK